MNTQIEYKVRPVTRFLVTRYETELPDEANPGRGSTGNSAGKGEFDNFETAYAVGYALCKAEHDGLGLPPGDMRICYPDPEPLADKKSQAALFRKMADSLEADAARERLMATRPELFCAKAATA